MKPANGPSPAAEPRDPRADASARFAYSLAEAHRRLDIIEEAHRTETGELDRELIRARLALDAAAERERHAATIIHNAVAQLRRNAHPIPEHLDKLTRELYELAGELGRNTEP